MGRQSKEDPTTFKYGQPLLTAVWPLGEFLFVGGGGGSAKTGIESRVVAAKFSNGGLSDEVGCVRLKNTIEQLAINPTSKLMLVATGTGVTAFDLEIKDDECSFIVPQTTVIEACNRLQDQGVCLVRFSSDGSGIAFGSASGHLRIWTAATFQERVCQLISIDGDKLESEIKDVDVSPFSDTTLAAVTCDNGSCYVLGFDGLESPDEEVSEIVEAKSTVELEKPSGLKAGAIKHCRFARSGDNSLFCTLNYRGDGFVGCWSQNRAGVFVLKVKSKKFNSITGMDVSPNGRHIGIATTEGESHLLDAATLKVRKSIKKAHMIFATSVAFSGESHAFVSTSADASARVLTLPAEGSFLRTIIKFLLFLMLIAVLVYLAQAHFASS